MSAVDTLRRAAARLRERGSAATPPPWGFGRIQEETRLPPWFVEINGGPVDDAGYLTCGVASWAEDDDGLRLSQPDGDWITTVHPGLAGPLAAWLDGEADICERVPVLVEHVPKVLDSLAGRPTGAQLPVRMSTMDRALAVARVLLGEERDA